MATLLLNRAVDGCASESLQNGLQGNWGLLFSHPADFALKGLEADRWLAIVQDAFARLHIRPVAVAPDQASYASNWIEQVEERNTLLFLDSELPSYADETEFNAIVLASAIARAPARFVMIVDSNLRLRRTFVYEQGDCVPSVLDFVAIVAKLMQTSSQQPEPPSPVRVLRHTLHQRKFATRVHNGFTQSPLGVAARR